MIGMKSFLVNLKRFSNCYITFGDDDNGKILNKNLLNYYDLCCLKDVLLVGRWTYCLVNIESTDKIFISTI